MYIVRIKVEMEDGGGIEYHAAITLAQKISRENPGFTVEVAQDKVWFSWTAPKED